MLAATADVPLPPAERLRRLAAFVDDRWDVSRGWPTDVLRAVHARVYDRALAIDPTSASVWASRSLSAQWVAALGWSDDGDAALAVASAREAVRLDPELGWAWWVLGRALYDGDGSLDEAHAAFDRAVRLDPDLGEAWRDRGHVDEDLGRWRDAIRGYEGALQRLGDLPRWRRRHLLDHLACCRLRAGEHEAALTGFLDVLADAEAALAEDEDPCLGPAAELRDEPPERLFEAADGALRDALGARVDALRRALAER